MLTCLFEGKRICSLDLINEFGIRDTQLEKQWRAASQADNLFCEECGSVVMLKAGTVKIPHFAHKANESDTCFFSSHTESEEHRKAKWIIYNYLKKIYGGDQIEVNFKHPVGIRSDFFISKSRIAIELQRLELSMTDWDRKNQGYNRMSILPIWVLFGKTDHVDKFRSDQRMDFFKRLVLCDAKDNILRVINVETENLVLFKEINYLILETNRIKYQEIFCKDYFVGVGSDVRNIFKDFKNYYEERKKMFIDECKRKEEHILQTKLNLKPQVNSSDIPQNIHQKKRELKHSETKRGTCVFCGEYTDQWWSYDGKDGTCKCYKCREKGRR